MRHIPKLITFRY